MGACLILCNITIQAAIDVHNDGTTVGYMAMGHSLLLHFGVDEHPFATYFDVQQRYRVLTHSHIAITSGAIILRQRPCFGCFETGTIFRQLNCGFECIKLKERSGDHAATRSAQRTAGGRCPHVLVL